MRISRVFTVCAAFISAFLGAETVHSERRSQSTGQIEAKPETNIDVSEITFTTLYPEVPSSTQKTPPNAYLAGNRKPARIHHRPSSLFTGSRRRRQLQKNGSNSARSGRSLDISENDIEHHQVDTLQKPDAFEKGVVHIEPIFRVTKNKNIFDSIISMVNRIFEPPKSQLGPLVGPFNFPGVSDKVYIRLLDSVEPKHLVIRLISHLPASEVETTLQDKPVSTSELLGHEEIPSISHETLSLSTDELEGTSNLHAGLPSSAISLDSLESPSSSVVHVSKSANVLNQAILSSNLANEAHRPSQLPDSIIQKPIPVRKRNQRLASPATQNTQNPNNQNMEAQYPQGENAPAFDQVRSPIQYQTTSQSAFNQSTTENPLKFKVYDFINPVNASSFQKFPSEPIIPYSPPFSQYQAQKNLSDSVQSRPHYSIEYTSKKMRYLNMDGTVVTSDDDHFKPVEKSSILTRSMAPGQYREAFRTSNARNDQSVQKRSDSKPLQNTRRRNNNNSRNVGSSNQGINTEKQPARCSWCQADENESDRHEYTSKPVLDDHHENKSRVNNSVRLGAATVRPPLDSSSIKPSMQLLHLHRQLDASKRNSN